MTTKFNARQVANLIEANTEMLKRGKMSRATFDRMQERAWDLVSQGEPRVVGSECAARYHQVLKLLSA